jgi:hypothetical protein
MSFFLKIKILKSYRFLEIKKCSLFLNDIMNVILGITKNSSFCPQNYCHILIL